MESGLYSIKTASMEMKKLRHKQTRGDGRNGVNDRIQDVSGKTSGQDGGVAKHCARLLPHQNYN